MEVPRGDPPKQPQNAENNPLGTNGLIKSRLEIIEGRYVSDTVLSNLLNMLVNMSIVEKRDDEYSIIDPIYAAAARTL